MSAANTAHLFAHVVGELFFIFKHIISNFDDTRPNSFDLMPFPKKAHFIDATVQNPFFLMLRQIRIRDSCVYLVVCAKAL